MVDVNVTVEVPELEKRAAYAGGLGAVVDPMLAPWIAYYPSSAMKRRISSRRSVVKGRDCSLLGLCLAVTLFAGCSSHQSPSWPWPGPSILDREQMLQGPLPLIGEDFETVDLIPLLDSTATAQENDEYEVRLREAYDNFYQAQNVIQRRNGAQERIIAASNQRCGEYKKFVKRIDTETNIFLGWLTTAAGGAGAIVTAAAAARALSGVAAIMSGVRAEANEAYFHNLTIQVLTDGMEKKRQEIYREIRENQQKNVTAYPVEKAIGDAIFYHDHCSLLAGLEFSAASLRRATDPGLNRVNQTLETLEQTRRGMNSLAALNTDVPQVVLPLSAFYTAQKTADELDRKLNRLKNLSVPEAEKDTSQQRQAEIGETREKKKTLEKEVELQLTNWKNTELSDEEREKVKNIQTALQTVQTELYTSATANDSAEIEGAKAKLRIRQNEAEEVRLQYQKLTDEIQMRLDEVQRFIKRVERLNTQ